MAHTLSELALRVKNASPEFFDAFVEGLELYREDAVDGLTSAPATDILVQQGRVQQINAFLRLLRECHMERKKPEPPSPQP